MKPDFSFSGRTSPALRILTAGLTAMIGLIVLGVKLYREQIHSTDEHRARIRRQTVRRIRIPAPRGRILSSDLKILAENRPCFDVVFYLEEMRREAGRGKTVEYAVAAADAIAAWLDIGSDVTGEKVFRHINNTPGLPFTAFRNLNERQLADFYEFESQFRGVGVECRFERFYPERRLAAPLLGFVRNAEPRAAGDRGEYNYYLPDAEGRAGLEKACDGDVAPGVRGLLGTPGYSLVQVDYLGYVNRELIDKVDATPGNNVILSIDSEAQRICEYLLDGHRGAMVVLDGDTGDVIAMASAPGYDANEFMPSISSRRYNELLNDPEKPLINRPVSGTYMPGSILKPLIAEAIMEAGVDPGETVECDGQTRIGNASIRCTSVHGSVNLEQALQYSCNDYFIEMGMRIGLEPIISVLRRAGIGSPPGIEVPGASGKLPDADEFRRREKRSWNRANTALLSIGQGMITISPLQAARYFAAVANGGFLVEPRLVKSVNRSDGQPLYTAGDRRGSDTGFSPAALAHIREGMRMAVKSGTGRAAANAAIELYGKTGTAEVGPRSERRKNVWFAGFGSRGGRTYVIVILLEDEQSGGRDCAPLAAAFFLDYLGVPPAADGDAAF